MSLIIRDKFTGLFFTRPFTLKESEAALMRAIMDGRNDDVRQMFENSAVDVNIEMGLPMVLAARAKKFPIAQMLAKHGASFEMAIKTAKTRTDYYSKVWQGTKSNSAEEKEAATARQEWATIQSNLERFYAADQELNKRNSAQSLDNIAEQLRLLNETIREITKPRHNIIKETSLNPPVFKGEP